MRLSAGMYRLTSQSPLSCSRRRSWISAAISGLKANAFQAKRPPGRSDAETRSKTRRLSAHVGRWSSDRNGQMTRSTGSSSESSRMSPSRSSTGRPAARSRATASISGERSIPITRFPVSRAIGIATRPVPTASSTIGSPASRASSTYHATSSVMSADQAS